MQHFGEFWELNPHLKPMILDDYLRAICRRGPSIGIYERPNDDFPLDFSYSPAHSMPRRPLSASRVPAELPHEMRLLDQPSAVRQRRQGLFEHVVVAVVQLLV